MSVCVKLIWRATSRSHTTTSAVGDAGNDAAGESNGDTVDVDITGSNAASGGGGDGNHSNSNSDENSEHDQGGTDRSDEGSQLHRLPGNTCTLILLIYSILIPLHT